MKIFSLIALVLGTFLLYEGFRKQRQSGYLGSNGKETVAVVFDNKEYRNESGTSYSPVALFTTEDGYIVKHVFEKQSEAIEPGTEIEIVYDPQDPNVAMTRGRNGTSANPYIFYGGGILCLLVAIFLSRPGTKN